MENSPPQLRMGFTQFDALVAPQPVPGYGLRTFRPGDEDAWVNLLATGDFGEWDRDRLDRMLAEERAPLPLEGIFLATCNDQPVGAACVFFHDEEGRTLPELGWVVVHPAHRGHAMGIQVCRAALGFIHRLGHDYAYLLTEDVRLPAIRMYLQLGFEPELVHPLHTAQWEELRQALASREAGCSDQVSACG